MSQLRVLACVCTIAVGTAALGHAQARQPAAFERLKTLVGEWEGKTDDGHTAIVTYRLTSNGSVLVETIKPGDPMEMVTLFHPDGDGVVATHYCAAQNQPRMRASGISGDIREISFKFLDITNLASPQAGHMRDLVITFQDTDHFTARWSYRENGKDTPSVFHYTRRK